MVDIRVQKKIDIYLSKIYNKFRGDKDEMEELKSDMKDHILMEIELLINDGYSLDVSYEKAMKKFGSSRELEKDISSIFEYKNKYMNILVKLCISYLLVLVIGFKLISLNVQGISLGIHMYLLLIPVYLIISCIYMLIDKKDGIISSYNRNLYSILFGVYIISILSIIIFPLEISSGLGNLYFSEIYLSNNMRNLLLSAIKYIILSIPMGAAIPFLFNNFTKKHKIILIAIIPIVILIISLLKCILGQNVSINLYQYIGSIIGVFIGYFLKDKINRK
ncbi:MAG: hypothetical protein GX275_14060 [Clostridiales bacterium]|nr:hypothetical protein [Clostridiales bacterium]